MIIHRLAVSVPVLANIYEHTLRETAARMSLPFAFMVRERTNGVRN